MVNTQRIFFRAYLCLHSFRSCSVLWAVSMMQGRFSVREKLAEQNIVFRWGIIYLAIFSILIFGAYGKGFDPAAFIYTQY